MIRGYADIEGLVEQSSAALSELQALLYEALLGDGENRELEGPSLTRPYDINSGLDLYPVRALSFLKTKRGPIIFGAALLGSNPSPHLFVHHQNDQFHVVYALSKAHVKLIIF